MGIQMAGIDCGRAELAQREAFAFTKSQTAQAVHTVRELEGVEGCVIVSTCNRTELWLYADSDHPSDPAGLLCRLKGLPEIRFADRIVERSGREAVRHLFETACGLRSRIWGEDQIITQIRDAAGLSIAEGTCGKVLAKLFQTAVTSAKKIKTQVRFASGNASVAAAAVAKCLEMGGDITGRRCLVIGSGAMGRLAAREFAANGAHVSMTLRQYKYGVSAVAENCRSIPYDDRIAEIGAADIIVSATSSPHYTLRRDPVEHACTAHPKSRILIDLAVPRDIEPRIAELPSCLLLTIDDIPCRERAEERAAVEARCHEIINHYIAEFEKYRMAWSTLPQIERLSEEFRLLLGTELEKALAQTNIPPEERDRIVPVVQRLAGEKAGKMLFAFRDWMEEHTGDEKAKPRPYARATN